MRRFPLALLFVVPVLIILLNLPGFPFLRGFPYSDLAVSHYPNGLFLKQSILEWKEIPLWSPSILSGYPFAANPLSGLYYLPGWLALLFPLPDGFNLVVALHMLWGGLGMVLFLRAEKLSWGPVVLGALTFEALPKLFSHLGAGHLTMIYAVSWTPWLLYAEKKTLNNVRTRWVLPGLVLGLIVLADARWAAYAGVLWLAYSLRNQLIWTGSGVSLMGMKSLKTGRWLFSMVTNTLFALLIAAPLLLPLAEYTRLSTRIDLTAQESLTLSLPPGQLFGLVYPYIGGTAEWMLYPGAATFALVLYALFMPLTRQRIGFWLALIGLTLAFSLGSNIPYLDLAARLPGFDLLRVPPRVLFLTGFCFAVAASYALQSLHWRIEGREWATKDLSGLVLFGVTVFVVLFGLAVWLVVEDYQARLQFAWGALFLGLATVFIFLARARRISTGLLTVVIILISMIDLNGVNLLSLEFRPVEAVEAPGQTLASYLSGRMEHEIFRIYSPSYSIPQQVAVGYRLELADGVDPLQLAAYVGFMEEATGVPKTGYSVTLPPFATGSPETDNRGYSPNPEMLGLLNVQYVVTEYPLRDSRMFLLARFGQARIYQNPFALPRAWVQPPDAPLGKNIISKPWVAVRPNWIVIKAQGPGLLVLSELAYPGWQVFIDEQQGEIETVENLFRGVTLSEGEHLVKFVFHPPSVYAGLAASAIAWLFLILLLLLPRRRNG
jgi:hypothetical protein